jgi:hypothetical protein
MVFLWCRILCEIDPLKNCLCIHIVRLVARKDKLDK